MTRDLVIEPMGDAALRWRRDPGRDPRALLDALRALPGVVDAIVTEAHALVTFDPARPPDAPWAIEERVSRESHRPATREHVIRASYDGADLDEVAARAGVTRAEVIDAHTSGVYSVRLIGFLPGFAYLGPVDPRLALPRRASPRARIDAGSIGLGAGYTAVYPFASPGGWHLIARAVDFTPFDSARGATLGLGDRVRFEVAG
jgi:UPF0271 protein